MNVQETNLVEVLSEVTNKVKLASTNKKIELVFSSSQPEIMASVDHEQLERALLNILNNCIRHTAPLGQIDLNLEKVGSEIKIEIKDRGEGIPEEDLPYIWDRFYRVDKSRTSKQGGSGLGLAITKQIVELHGGEIRIESVVGVGTTFIITLSGTVFK